MALSRNLHLAGFTVLWLCAAWFGLSRLQTYESTASPPAERPAAWPGAAPLARTPGCCTVLLFLHPHCPCSAAMARELEGIVARVKYPADWYALFVAPDGASTEWEKGNLWTRLAALPGFTVRRDEHGELARTFGARTSGQVLVFDPQARLAFSGGITRSRGHEGDNAGQLAVQSILNGSPPPVAETPVYGCPLFDDDHR